MIFKIVSLLFVMLISVDSHASFIDYVSQSDVDNHFLDIAKGAVIAVSLLVITAVGLLLVDFVKRSSDQTVETQEYDIFQALAEKDEAIRKQDSELFEEFSHLEPIHDQIDFDTIEEWVIAEEVYPFAMTDSHGLVCLDPNWLYVSIESMKEQLEEELFFGKKVADYRDLRR